ncbi:MAG: hypothetical protein C0598_03340, partial [Marinilabiliales bacterium]
SNCIAEFSYFETGIVENEVQFLDMSSFNIDNRYWDFGDGTDSYEQNPIHIYSDKGTYTVSLFVYSNISQCDDVITKTVVIDDTVNCYADFEYELDTLNNTPYTYIFNDASTQGTIEWYWDFGDGNFSTEQNPVHTYENPGNYNVCLTSMSGQPIANCIDLVCKEISTPAYYNFGGHAFIDGFTINIDENDSSNKATAYLYRKYENQWKYMDKRDFWKFGYYWFVQKPEGEYMLRFELDNTSKDYDNYAPSYYGDKTSWTYASSFDLQSDNQFAINVNLVKLKGLAACSGSISGSLVSDETCVQEIDLADKIVKLFKDDDYVLFTKTDNFGRYEFGSLPLGNYILQAEISGFLSTVEKVQITDNEPFSEDNQLVLACDAYVGLEEIVFNSTTLQLENVYPVPAKDFIIFSFISYEEDEITIELSDLLGKEIGKYKFQLVHNNSEFIINLENSDASIVLYKIISSDGNLISNGKFVRNNQ